MRNRNPLIVLVVLLVGGGVFWFVTRPKSVQEEAAGNGEVGLANPAAADYSTFQTEDGNFSFDYPVNWSRTEVENLEAVLPEDFVNKYSLTMPLLLSNSQGALISLSIYSFEEGTDLETAMDALEAELLEMGKPYNEISRETVGGSLVVDSAVDEQGTTMQVRDILYLGQGGVVYNLSLVAPQDIWSDYETIFSHIQSSAQLSF